MGTKIEWTDEVWNPVTGCTQISEGCANCYAKKMAQKLKGRYGYPEDEPFRVTVHPERLSEPLSWRKPRKVFVCSMSDLFHDDIPHRFIQDVLLRVRHNPIHTFLILTKRPGRMKQFFQQFYIDGRPIWNLWLGVTAENQARADERIPVLLSIPAAKRFVSIEPMLSPILVKLHLDGMQETKINGHSIIEPAIGGFKLDWVICGGETGAGARPAKAEWFNALIEQCESANVPVFVKKAPEGVEIIREFPEERVRG